VARRLTLTFEVRETVALSDDELHELGERMIEQLTEVPFGVTFDGTDVRRGDEHRASVAADLAETGELPRRDIYQQRCTEQT
jgi:hypothetical protein